MSVEVSGPRLPLEFLNLSFKNPRLTVATHDNILRPGLFSRFGGGPMKQLLWITALAATSVLAQEFRGTISGVVVDPQNAVVSGATVTVTETNTGTKVASQSNTTGEYTAALLLPGDYEVKVE